MLGSLRIAVLALAGLVAAAPRPATTRQAGFKYVTVTTHLDENGLPRRIHRKEMYFIGDIALVVDAEGVPDMMIDLKRQVASDEQGSRWPLADLQQRAEQDREGARKRVITTHDPELAQRMKYDLDPALAFSDEGGRLVVTNPVSRYEIDVAPADAQYHKRLFAAMRLQTYASASATSPPFVSLALIEEMERRGCIIGDAKVVTKSGNKESEMRIQSRLSALSVEDQRRLATLLLPAGGL